MSRKEPTTTPMEAGKLTIVPRLRFSEFRLAAPWSLLRMDELYSFKGNNSLSRDKLNYEAGSVKNIHYGDIHTRFSTHFDIAREIVPFVNESEADFIRTQEPCAEGDMIFADASEDLADIGKSIEIVSLNGEHVVSGLHTILARRLSERIALGFGGHLFKSGWVRAQIQREAQGAKVLGISPSRLRNLRLPLPRPAEQRKIVACLSSVDELIAAQAQKVDELKTHKKGLMQQLLPREGETQPRLRFPEFRNTDVWNERRLDDLAARGSGHTPSKSNPKNYNGGIKWVSLADSKRLDCGTISDTAIEISELGIQNSSAVLHPEGTVLISRDAGIGKSAVMGVPMAVSQHFIVWTCDSRQLCNWFLYHHLQNSKPLFERAASGSTIKTIGLQFFVDFVFRVPKLHEQERIANCLNSLDSIVAAETRKLEKIMAHRHGLMQQLFPFPGTVES